LWLALINTHIAQCHIYWFMLVEVSIIDALEGKNDHCQAHCGETLNRRSILVMHTYIYGGHA